MSAVVESRDRRIRLLVVDDESIITFALQAYFRAHGFEIDTAAEREEAIALLSTREYDVLIADLRLTGTNGEEGLDVIRFARERNCSSGIVLLTAYGSANVASRAAKAGADVILYKPKPLPDIASTVTALLEARAT